MWIPSTDYPIVIDRTFGSAELSDKEEAQNLLTKDIVRPNLGQTLAKLNFWSFLAYRLRQFQIHNVLPATQVPDTLHCQSRKTTTQHTHTDLVMDRLPEIGFSCAHLEAEINQKKWLIFIIWLVHILSYYLISRSRKIYQTRKVVCNLAYLQYPFLHNSGRVALPKSPYIIVFRVLLESITIVLHTENAR